MSAEQVAADLRAAAEVLRRDGWTQGVLHTTPDCGGAHCARGAIHVATGVVASYETDDMEQAMEADMRAAAAERALADAIALDGVIAWNDQRSRTADEVIAALEAAAEAVQ